MTKKLVLVPLGAAALVLSAVAMAFACTNFEGKFVVSGNTSGTVTANAIGTGMTQTVDTGIARSSPGSGSVNVSTGTSTNDSTTLPAGIYNINFYNNPSTTCTTTCGYNGTGTTRTWKTDCMSPIAKRSPVVNLGNVEVNSSGVIFKRNGVTATQPVNFALIPTSGLITNTAGSNESAVCISTGDGFFGNQAPLTIL